MTWYGNDAWWLIPFEKDATRAYGSALRVGIAPGVRAYTHPGLDVPGREDPVPVRVEFHADAPYELYGLRPQDYPRVIADPRGTSDHRLPSGALCLYSPYDPPGLRWTSEHGLLALLNIVRDHLFAETAAPILGYWPAAEAPHGLPVQGAA